MILILKAIAIFLALLIVAAVIILLPPILNAKPVDPPAFNPSAIPAPQDALAAKPLDIAALCDNHDPDRLTTIDISKRLRSPPVRVLSALFEGKTSIWSDDEITQLSSQLDALLANADGVNQLDTAPTGARLIPIARPGLSQLKKLRRIHNHEIGYQRIINDCAPGGLLNRDEHIQDCLAREYITGNATLPFTHMGFLLRSKGDYRVLHAYPVQDETKTERVTFFCEPLDEFLGVPMGLREVMVMIPPEAEQRRLATVIEGPLGAQIRHQRYSMMTRPDAPDVGQSNGPALHATLAALDSKLEGSETPYDLRTFTAEFERRAFRPGILMLGRPAMARIGARFLPPVDLTMQRYGRHGVFASVTPQSIIEHVMDHPGGSGWRHHVVGLDWSEEFTLQQLRK